MHTFFISKYVFKYLWFFLFFLLYCEKYRLVVFSLVTRELLNPYHLSNDSDEKAFDDQNHESTSLYQNLRKRSSIKKEMVSSLKWEKILSK